MLLVMSVVGAADEGAEVRNIAIQYAHFTTFNVFPFSSSRSTPQTASGLLTSINRYFNPSISSTCPISKGMRMRSPLTISGTFLETTTTVAQMSCTISVALSGMRIPPSVSVLFGSGRTIIKLFHGSMCLANFLNFNVFKFFNKRVKFFIPPSVSKSIMFVFLSWKAGPLLNILCKFFVHNLF
jgi:hypothetical protein